MDADEKIELGQKIIATARAIAQANGDDPDTMWMAWMDGAKAALATRHPEWKAELAWRPEKPNPRPDLN